MEEVEMEVEVEAEVDAVFFPSPPPPPPIAMIMVRVAVVKCVFWHRKMQLETVCATKKKEGGFMYRLCHEKLTVMAK